ncbi:TetR/AcrR family transcriptional regulator [Microbaculum sp. FT89]|uniref:TetR/AcrR family transcriptional regulator n=1 Tax=Microbaculum sp. FT89 TaxID=3447298 RepID=UPI003F537D62
MNKRPYRMRKRAESQAETRRKIIEATIALHQTKGPAATSMADVAKKAGVGKVTVYRHFPDEPTLSRACSGLYFERHPVPDPEAWRRIADPRKRLRHGLGEAYAYHAETHEMMGHVLADARDHPVMRPYHALWASAAEIILEAWLPRDDEKALRAGLVMALTFETWRALVKEQGLSQDQAVALMERLMCDCEE